MTLDANLRAQLSAEQLLHVGTIVSNMSERDYSDEEITTVVRGLFVDKGKGAYWGISRGAGQISRDKLRDTLLILGDDLAEATRKELNAMVDSAPEIVEEPYFEKFAMKAATDPFFQQPKEEKSEVNLGGNLMEGLGGSVLGIFGEAGDKEQVPEDSGESDMDWSLQQDEPVATAMLRLASTAVGLKSPPAPAVLMPKLLETVLQRKPLLLSVPAYKLRGMAVLKRHLRNLPAASSSQGFDVNALLRVLNFRPWPCNLPPALRKTLSSLCPKAGAESAQEQLECEAKRALVLARVTEAGSSADQRQLAEATLNLLSHGFKMCLKDSRRLSHLVRRACRQQAASDIPGWRALLDVASRFSSFFPAPMRACLDSQPRLHDTGAKLPSDTACGVLAFIAKRIHQRSKLGSGQVRYKDGERILQAAVQALAVTAVAPTLSAYQHTVGLEDVLTTFCSPATPWHHQLPMALLTELRFRAVQRSEKDTIQQKALRKAHQAFMGAASSTERLGLTEFLSAVRALWYEYRLLDKHMHRDKLESALARFRSEVEGAEDMQLSIPECVEMLLVKPLSDCVPKSWRTHFHQSLAGPPQALTDLFEQERYASACRAEIQQQQALIVYLRSSTAIGDAAGMAHLALLEEELEEEMHWDAVMNQRAQMTAASMELQLLEESLEPEDELSHAPLTAKDIAARSLLQMSKGKEEESTPQGAASGASTAENDEVHVHATDTSSAVAQAEQKRATTADEGAPLTESPPSQGAEEQAAGGEEPPATDGDKGGEQRRASIIEEFFSPHITTELDIKLIQASTVGCALSILSLVQAKAAVNAATDSNGFSAVTLAALHAHTEAVHALLEGRADIGGAMDAPLSPLQAAVIAGSEHCVNLCLKAGAHPGLIWAENGLSALQLAALTSGTATVSIVAALVKGLQADAPCPASPSEACQAALLRACACGNLHSTEALYTACADVPGVLDSVMKGPLQHAAALGHHTVVAYLLKQQAGQFDDAEVNAALHCAVASGHKEAVAAFTDAHIDVNTRTGPGSLSALDIAVLGNKPEALRVLCTAPGIVLDNGEYTALMHAAASGNSKVSLPSVSPSCLQTVPAMEKPLI